MAAEQNPSIQDDVKRRNRAGRRAAKPVETGPGELLTALLDVVLDELLGVLLEDVVDLIEKIIHV